MILARAGHEPAQHPGTLRYVEARGERHAQQSLNGVGVVEPARWGDVLLRGLLQLEGRAHRDLWISPLSTGEAELHCQLLGSLGL